MDTQSKKDYINRYLKIYPFLKGFTDDLSFFIIIDTLFLTICKGLNAQQIVSLTTVSTFLSIICRLPFIKIIKKIGNTFSARLGIGMLTLSAIIITFGTNYLILMIGKVIYELSWIFKDMENVMLKNNLSVIGRDDDYARITNNSMIVYAFLTVVIALCSGILFNIDHYLPMYICIAICMIAFIVYFYMKDISNAENIPFCETNETKDKKILSSVMFLILISSGIVLAIITTGQQNSKLLIQYELSDLFSTERVSFYLSIIVAFSRISRLLSAMAFKKIYPKLKNKSLKILPVLLFGAFTVIVAGHFVTIPFLKFFLMTTGLCLAISVRDPYNIFTQDTVLKLSLPQERQAAISYIQFANKTGITICSLLISAALLKWDMIYVISGTAVLSFLEILIAFKLYALLIKKRDITTDIQA